MKKIILLTLFLFFSNVFSQTLIYNDINEVNRRVVSLNLETKEKNIIIPEEYDPFSVKISNTQKLYLFVLMIVYHPQVIQLL